MRVHRLALCLVLVACGGSKPAAKSPVTESATMSTPGGGASSDTADSAAEPVEATKAEPAMAPGAPAPQPASAPAPAKPATRGATVKTKKSEDPDAGGE